MRKRDCEMLLVLEMEGTAILTSGIIFTKSDKTEKKKKELKVLHLFFHWKPFTFTLYAV